MLDDVALGAGLATEPLGDDSLVVVGQVGGLLAELPLRRRRRKHRPST